MARAKAQDSVTRYNPTSGRMQPIVGAEVRVYENNDLGSPLVATMYDALTAGNVLPWPLTTDANGFWFFFLAAPQQVSLVITYPGMTTRTVHDVRVEVPSGTEATQADITTAVSGLVSSASLATTLSSYATTAAAILKSLVTTAGDLIYATGSAAVARLPVGTANQELGVNAGATAPQWFDGARKVMTTAGDMLYASAANTLARLAKGTAFQELVMNAGATAPSWATGVLALAAAAGDTFYATGANALAKLTLGTKGQALLAGATAPVWGDLARNNLLINASGQINQRVTAASTDNAYGPDCWRLLLEAATAGTLGQATSNLPATGSAQTGLVLTIGASNNNKVGMVQMLRNATCGDLRGGVVSLQFKGKVNNARIADVRAAVIEFTGPADNGGSAWGSPISAWGAAGTNPTLVFSGTGYVYCGTPVNLSPTTSDGIFKVENIPVSSSMKNLGLLLWIDDKTTTAADWLTVTDIQVEPGAICTAVDRPKIEDVIDECEVYYQKSVDLTATPLSTAQGEAYPTYNGTVANGDVWARVKFGTRMYGTPTVRIWPWTTPSNTSRVSNSGGTDLAASSGAPYAPKAAGFAVQNSSGGALTAGSNILLFAWDSTAPW